VAVPRDQWHRLRIETEGQRIRASLGDRQLIDYQAERRFTGHLGLWTKADSVTLFRNLTVNLPDGRSHIFQ
jgi:hypothetical protein